MDLWYEVVYEQWTLPSAFETQKKKRLFTVFFPMFAEIQSLFFFACAASELITVNLNKVTVTELNYYVDSFLSR